MSSGTLQEPDLRPIIFHSLINAQEEDMKSLLMSFTADTKIDRVVNYDKDRSLPQNRVHSDMDFDMAKCKITYLGIKITHHT